jgi:hypothetical protein
MNGLRDEGKRQMEPLQQSSQAGQFDSAIKDALQKREAAWDELKTNIGAVSAEIQSQLDLLDSQLQIERDKLKSLYDAIEKEAATEREKREKLIEDAVSGADREIRKQLAQATDSSAAVAALAHSVTEAYERRIPLYELEAPVHASKRLAAFYAAFNRALTAWKRVYRPGAAKQFPSPANKPKSRPKSAAKKANSPSKKGGSDREGGAALLGRAVSYGKKQAKRVGRYLGLLKPSPLKKNPLVISDELKQWIQERERQQSLNEGEALSALAKQAVESNGAAGENSSLSLPPGLGSAALVTELRRLAAEFLLSLSQLRVNLLESARNRINLRRTRQRTQLESNTAIPQLEKSIQTFRGGRDARALRLLQARLASDEQVKRLQSAVDGAELALREQQALAEQTRLGDSKPNSSGRNVNFPDPSSANYAEQIARQFSNLQMGPADSASSRCGKDAKNEPPREFQTLIASLIDPDNPTRGVLADHGVGSGKTRAAIMAIERWFIRNIESTQQAGPAVLVLVPFNETIDVWVRESAQWMTRFEVTTKSVSGGSGGTHVLELHALAPLPDVDAYIIIHRMTLVLPKPVFNIMRDSTTDEDGMIIGDRKYVLASADYHTHPAYRELTSAEKSLLTDAYAKQVPAVLKKFVAVPSRGLIIVDEAHYLPASSEIARDVTAAATVLAWANVISQAPKAKLLELTATPVLDKLADLFKLLNLEDEKARPLYFEGTWRRTLARDEPEKLQVAYTKADEAEGVYLEKQMFEKDGRWRPGQKEQLQKTYASVLSFITLENDLGVYPRFSKKCTTDTCTYEWTGQTIKPITEPELKRLGLPKPAIGRTLLVPYATPQQKIANAAMSSDLNNFAKTRRLGSPANVATPAEINYGASERVVKSSVLASIGMKTFAVSGAEAWAPKLAALAHLLSLTPTDKVFAYSTSAASGTNRVFAPKTAAYFRKEGYEVLTISSATQFLRAHADITRTKDLVELWYANAKPGKRVVLYAKLPENAGAGATQMTKRREFLSDVFNDPRNIRGEFVRAFIGDRSTSVGISLFGIMVIVLLDVPASETMETQVEGRAFRTCSHKLIPHNRWADLVLWRFVSMTGADKSAAKKGRRRRVGGVGSPRSAFPLPPTVLSKGKTVAKPRVKTVAKSRTKSVAKVASKSKAKSPVAKAKSPIAKAKLQKEEEHTNEEWQFIHLEKSQPVSTKVLTALEEAAIDCRLFRAYNGKPASCVGEAPSPVPKEAKSVVSVTRLDRYCAARGSVCLQDAAEETLTFVDNLGMETSNVPVSQFEKFCRYAENAKITNLATPGYWDVLIGRALTAPRDPLVVAAIRNRVTANLIAAKQPSDAVNLALFLELLNELSSPPRRSRLKDELETWSRATTLDHEHAALLFLLISHRVRRIAKPDVPKYGALLAQLESNMRLELGMERARNELLNAISARPKLSIVSSRSKE